MEIEALVKADPSFVQGGFPDAHQNAVQQLAFARNGSVVLDRAKRISSKANPATQVRFIINGPTSVMETPGRLATRAALTPGDPDHSIDFKTGLQMVAESKVLNPDVVMDPASSWINKAVSSSCISERRWL